MGKIMRNGIAYGGKGKDGKDGNVYVYTREEFEAIKDTIPEGQIFSIVDDTPVSPTNAKRTMILIGDSYGLDTEWWQSWQTIFKENNPQWKVYNGATGGAGFSIAAEGRNFLQTLQWVQSENPDMKANEVTDIVVLGGCNDVSATSSITPGNFATHLSPYVEEFMNYCKSTFLNATIHVGCIAVDYNSPNNNYRCEMMNQAYEKLSVKYNFKFNRNFKFILLQKAFLFFQDGNANSGFHPNTTGNTDVARYLSFYLQNGNFTVRKGIIQNGCQVYAENGHVTIMSNTYSATPTYFLDDALNNSGTIPFNSWKKICDLGENGDNLIWGAEKGYPQFSKTIWKIADGQPTNHISTLQIQIKNKEVYAKCVDNLNGVTFDKSTVYVASSDTLHFDYQVMY